jgi:hypothetical protein
VNLLHDISLAVRQPSRRRAAFPSMGTVTAPEQVGMHSAMSFNSEPVADVALTYNLALEDEHSPASTHFPSGQQSPILSSSGPLPNPPFVFPARPASSAPSSFSRATVRRPRSAYDFQIGAVGSIRDLQMGSGRSGPPPLPNFSFSQAAPSNNVSGIASPPQSPDSPSSIRAIPTRPGGHRRGGSEFIGGDGKSGSGLGLMSTSPTKGEGVLPPPTSQFSLGPSGARRGHAHRRSAAISCHDLSMIIKPPSSINPTFGGSAPTTPSANENQVMMFPSPDGTGDRSNLTSFSCDKRETTGSSDSPPSRTTNRNRVGFSDTIEFIPRPLSLVSSDASSTATMRPGHSVSNSISSLMSAGNASPPPKDHRDSPARETDVETRPSTAGAILGHMTESTRLDHGSSNTQRPHSVHLTSDESNKPIETPLTPRHLPRKYFFFGHDASAGESSPTRSRPVSSASSEKSRSASNISDPSSPDHPSSDVLVNSTEEDPVVPRRPSLTRKPSKKQKKVKSWAGSILSRKTRQRSQKQKGLSRRSPTPPLRSFEPLTDVVPAPQMQALEPSVDAVHGTEISDMSILQTNYASWKPRHISPQDDDSMSPIIDLDAALGPFNTPMGYDASWEASQRGSGPTRRRMHSAVGIGGLGGPYHRRAESAPEMVAFENPRYGLHHIGSRSTMEDVFEEDEEDDWEEVNSVSHKGSKMKVEDEEETGLGIDITVVDAENNNPDKAMDWTTDRDSSLVRGLKRKGSGLSEGERRQGSSSSKSELSLRDDTVAGDITNDLDVPDNSTTSRPTSAAKSSTSLSTPPLRPHAAKDLAPVDVQPVVFQPPFLTPTSFQSTGHSSFPSPRSPVSYDAQRISTAGSSFTDEHGFQSLLLGEPGPEIRMSVDDVPSLTSDTSTMTRESVLHPGHPGFNNPQFRNGQRSTSLSGPSVTRNKRSSIASLSRLLHSSHGEKSKLSIEERAPSSPERKGKEGRGKRLSRMMQFWKPRDPSPS